MARHRDLLRQRRSVALDHRHRYAARLGLQHLDEFPVDVRLARMDAPPQRRARLARRDRRSLALGARVALENPVALRVQRVLLPAEDQRLIDDPNGSSDRHGLVQDRDVFGIQAHAAVARAHPDAVCLVGAVDQVAGPAEPEHEGAKRVVGTRGDLRRQHVAVLEVLLAHRHRRHPNRILDPRNDAGGAFGRLPADLADADRMGDHQRRRAARDLGVIVEAHRRDIDHDALVGRVRQHEAGRDQHVAAGARQPRIDAGIGAYDLLVADVEAPRKVGQRVVGGRGRDDQRADYRVCARRQRELVGRGRALVDRPRRRGRRRRPWRGRQGPQQRAAREIREQQQP